MEFDIKLAKFLVYCYVDKINLETHEKLLYIQACRTLQLYLLDTENEIRGEIKNEERGGLS